MQPPIQPLLGNGYILAVEDSLVQAKRLEHFFKKNSINYKISSNAEDAYAEALSSSPSLIISDIIMPGMDGYEFCKAIKSNPSLSGIPIILLTSLQDSDDIIKGLQAGAENFISKPYDEANLLSRILHLLEYKTRCEPISTNDTLVINFHGKDYSVKSSKRQITELLLSIYETAIERNDEFLLTKSRLEKSNEDLSQANLDLNSIFKAINQDLCPQISQTIKFMEMAIDSIEKTADNDSIKQLSSIHKSLLGAVNFINDVNRFSQSYNAEINVEEVNLSNIANQIVTKLRLDFPDKNFKVVIDPDLKAKGDHDMIYTIMDNLLKNAFKFSSLKQNPEISIGRKDYYGNDLFFVKDNGVGLNILKAENLFQPFIRFHSENGLSGTGLGLSSSKKIIEKHGGKIWAESEEGNGSTFYFTLK